MMTRVWALVEDPYGAGDLITVPELPEDYFCGMDLYVTSEFNPSVPLLCRCRLGKACRDLQFDPVDGQPGFYSYTFEGREQCVFEVRPDLGEFSYVGSRDDCPEKLLPLSLANPKDMDVLYERYGFLWLGSGGKDEPRSSASSHGDL